MRPQGFQAGAPALVRVGNAWRPCLIVRLAWQVGRHPVYKVRTQDTVLFCGSCRLKEKT